jgi:hypothetical protein
MSTTMETTPVPGVFSRAETRTEVDLGGTFPPFVSFGEHLDAFEELGHPSQPRCTPDAGRYRRERPGGSGCVPAGFRLKYKDHELLRGGSVGLVLSALYYFS